MVNISELLVEHENILGEKAMQHLVGIWFCFYKTRQISQAGRELWQC